jgi:hypothetical protein
VSIEKLIDRIFAITSVDQNRSQFLKIENPKGKNCEGKNI